MPSPRDVRRQEKRRQKHQAGTAAPAPAATPARGVPLWLVAVAAIGGATIAGAVVLEMTRVEPKPETTVPRAPTPMPMPAGSTTPTFVPQPPGEVPPGKVWSPEHGHWHDVTPGQTPQ